MAKAAKGTGRSRSPKRASSSGGAASSTRPASRRRKPATKKPAAKKPAVKKSVKKAARTPAKRAAPATRKTTPKPAAKRASVAKKRVVKKPAARKPAAKKPVAKKPVAAPVAPPIAFHTPKTAPKAFQRQYKSWLRRLLSLRRQLFGETSQLEEEALRGGEGDASVDHLADSASDAFEQEFNISLIESKSEALHDVDEAIRKLDVGTYGLCEECEELIPRGRLEVLPHTPLCITCKSAQESGGW